MSLPEVKEFQKNCFTKKITIHRQYHRNVSTLLQIINNISKDRKIS